MITLRQLQHALLLAQHGNFARAARAAHISQPALSRSIHALEGQTGVRLFDRNGASVVPTLFGEVLLRRAKNAVGEADELLREIRLLQGLEAGELRVAAGVYAAEMSASPALGDLIAQHPNIDLRLKLTNWMEVGDLVTAGAVDLGVAEISTLERSRDLAVEPLGSHRLVLFCSQHHPLREQRCVSFEDLAPYPAVSPRLPPRVAGLFPGRTRQDPSTGALLPSVEVEDLSSARLLAAASHAFGVATPVQLEPWLRRGELAILNFKADWLTLDYGFIHLRQRMLSPIAEAYMQRVRAVEDSVAVRNRELFAELGL